MSLELRCAKRRGNTQQDAAPEEHTIGPRTCPCMKEEELFDVFFYFEIYAKVMGANVSSETYFILLTFNFFFPFLLLRFFTLLNIFHKL